jgi:biotin carboxylase
MSLEGKRLLVVLGSYRSKRHIYEHAAALGVKLVILDGPRHWASTLPGTSGFIERHLSVDLAPFSTFVERSLAAVRGSGLVFDGIGTIDEFAGGFAARIAHSLGLPFHDVAAADLARDKNLARQACIAAGLKSPRIARIENAADLMQAARIVGFPAVLKPVSGVGSVQTHRVGDLEDLKRRYATVVDESLSARLKNREGLSSDRDWFDLMWSGVPHLTLESWIEGHKYDVDILLDSGHVVYGHATDDLELCGLRDIRRMAPCGLDASQEGELIEHAAACVRAMGFKRGLFNVEVKRTADGPRMIEVNGRLGGYSTADIHRAVWGVDLVRQWARSALGLRPDVVETPAACFVAESLLPSPRSGTLQSDGFLDRLAGVENVLLARPWVFAGDVVAGVETGAPDWLGAVLTRGPTREAALAELDRHLNSLQFGVA